MSNAPCPKGIGHSQNGLALHFCNLARIKHDTKRVKLLPNFIIVDGHFLVCRFDRSTETTTMPGMEKHYDQSHHAKGLCEADCGMKHSNSAKKNISTHMTRIVLDQTFELYATLKTPTELTNPIGRIQMCCWDNCGKCFKNLQDLLRHIAHVHCDGYQWDQCHWTGCVRATPVSKMGSSRAQDLEAKHLYSGHLVVASKEIKPPEQDGSINTTISSNLVPTLQQIFIGSQVNKVSDGEIETCSWGTCRAQYTNDRQARSAHLATRGITSQTSPDVVCQSSLCAGCLHNVFDWVLHHRDLVQSRIFSIDAKAR